MKKMKGEKKAKREGYILLQEIPKLEYIFKNWNEFEDNFYVAEYNYNLKDFKFYMRKYITGIMRIWIYNYEIVMKRKGDEIEITLDDAKKIQCWDLMKILDQVFYPVMRFYQNTIEIEIVNNDVTYYIPIRPKEFKISLKLTENENEIKNAIANTKIKIDGKTLVIKKVGNKGKKYFMRRILRIPIYAKMMLKYRKITHVFAKMMLKKGILEQGEFRIMPLLKLEKLLYKKMNFRDIKYMKYFTMPIYRFNRDRVNLQGISYIDNFIITDYYYDGVNQIVFKLIAVDTRDPIVTTEKEVLATTLCGIDYKNNLWCVSISNLMLYWKISAVYKFMYDLDDRTKVFEY
ncbi:hypothetical protein [Deltalipothrixvirus pozzuoliense]|uniref:Uncharacterized protein ORF345 n=1 Tax=Acidianus filamentous virus 2 (isolate Italy/Pozzuoli) TaxID=654910 RepID=Y345_AFV2P|nr:hypothetical protein AFV2_gp02 [Acidianus filamentous virus 2]Q573G7.1 RecName: Full=Uncharacterized protein ORF345 [Acidianus filamentous virus 2 (isolate Pozzuoli)]CAH69389.1 hypothetical protein [Acidianus filamentous virus 2]